VNKVDDTLANNFEELALTYLRTAIIQLEKKREQITTINQRIIELVQDPDELETVILDAEEAQDQLLEKINELNQQVETLSRQTTVVPTVSQQVSSDKATSKAIHENGSTTTSTPQPFDTIVSATPAICASTVTASNTITTTALTLEPVTSTSLTTISLESVPPPISVTSTSYPAVTYVHSLGPPPLIPVSTDNSTTLLP